MNEINPAVPDSTPRLSRAEIVDRKVKEYLGRALEIISENKHFSVTSENILELAKFINHVELNGRKPDNNYQPRHYNGGHHDRDNGYSRSYQEKSFNR